MEGCSNSTWPQEGREERKGAEAMCMRVAQRWMLGVVRSSAGALSHSGLTRDCPLLGLMPLPL
jgi:hypothetical protein